MKFRGNILLNPWSVFSFWLVLWAARLVLIPAYFERTFELGYYPPAGDSIAIPIVGIGMITIFFGPVFAIGLWLLLRRSPVERRKWFAWSRRRWVVSLMWTILFCFFSLCVLPHFAEDVRIGLPLNAVADVGWFFLWLAVRAIVVSRISPVTVLTSQPPPNPIIQ